MIKLAKEIVDMFSEDPTRGAVVCCTCGAVVAADMRGVHWKFHQGAEVPSKPYRLPPNPYDAGFKRGKRG
jgi:transcription initiation factor TFIIIB Brf1 subunit/transcription initiation factor TFIIB